MTTRNVWLALAMVASMTSLGRAQGRGGRAGPPPPPARRDQVATEEQRAAVRKLMEQQRKEMLELRARHREQLDRTLPTEMRVRREMRQRQLMREGRAFERQRVMQRRGGPPGQGIGGQRGGITGPPSNAGQMRGMGMRGRGGMQPPPMRNGVNGRGPDGR